MSFFPLDRGLLTSTLWAQGKPEDRLLWIYLLLSANIRTGIVEETVPGMALRCGLPVAVVDAGLKWLASPDPYSRSKENEGKRIEFVPEGVKILNYSSYLNKDYSTPRVKKYYAKKHANPTRVSMVNESKTVLNRSQNDLSPPKSFMKRSGTTDTDTDKDKDKDKEEKSTDYDNADVAVTSRKNPVSFSIPPLKVREENLVATNPSSVKFPKKATTPKGFDPERVKKAKDDSKKPSAIPKLKSPKPEVDLGVWDRTNFFAISLDVETRNRILRDLEGHRGVVLAERMKKRLRGQVVEVYREERRKATGSEFLPLGPKAQVALEKIGSACIGYGLMPIDVITYWRDPANNFTSMKFPSLSFLASERNLEEAALALNPAKPGKSNGPPARNRSQNYSKPKEAGFAYDPDDLHPKLRETLKAAGFDVSELDDRSLMTVQNAGELLADGDTGDGFPSDDLKAKATAIAHLFKKE